VRQAASSSNTATAASTTEGSVYDRIREDILSLGLAPGRDLDEKTLAAQYGVSRTPIREALIRLSADGLIEFSPSRGARVSSLILPNLPRYLEMLDLCQRAFARIAAVRALPKDKKRLEAALTRFEKAVRALDITHYRQVIVVADAEADALRALSFCAHNAYLYEISDKLLVQGQRMLRLPFAYNPSAEGPVADYIAARLGALQGARDAIHAKDGAAAEAHLRLFHRALAKRLAAYVTENLAADVSVEPSDPNWLPTSVQQKDTIT